MIEDLLLEDEQSYDDDPTDPLAPLLASGVITEVLGELRSGKEGTAFCCRAHPSTGVEFLAAKLYRPRNHRSFKNDSVYREGVVLKGRDTRAVKNKTDWGRQVNFGTWIHKEFETLKTLHAAGADVPRPVTCTENVILMEFIGDAGGAAPLLNEVELTPAEARPLFQRTLSNLELLLRLDLVHGDLSAYNILYWKGGVTIIDFPQVVDARVNSNALPLLIRDTTNICRYWSRYGVKADPVRMAHFLWGQYVRAEL